VRLVDGSGREALAKRNGPAEGDYPTSAWEEGELVLDQHKLPLDLPPGRYTLEVAVLDGSRTVATKQLTKVEVR